jgi:hypothetical protein
MKITRKKLGENPEKWKEWWKENKKNFKKENF